MKKIAAAWSILLDPYLKQDIPAHVIPLLYAQAKLIRATHKFKEDTYDDALAYIVQSHDMHKEKSEEINTDELLEWKLNQELNGRSTFEKDDKFREEYKNI